jgi:hypothetical protein
MHFIEHLEGKEGAGCVAHRGFVQIMVKKQEGGRTRLLLQGMGGYGSSAFTGLLWSMVAPEVHGFTFLGDGVTLLVDDVATLLEEDITASAPGWRRRDALQCAR